MGMGFKILLNAHCIQEFQGDNFWLAFRNPHCGNSYQEFFQGTRPIMISLDITSTQAKLL